jgi:hypothetical protein
MPNLLKMAACGEKGYLLALYPRGGKTSREKPAQTFYRQGRVPLRPEQKFAEENEKRILTNTRYPAKITFVLYGTNTRQTPICGGIAQLGERLNGIQEVSGSIPLISTTSPFGTYN